MPLVSVSTVTIKGVTVLCCFYHDLTARVVEVEVRRRNLAF